MVYKASKLTLEELIGRLEGLIERLEGSMTPVPEDKEAQRLADQYVKQQVLERGGNLDE